MYDEARQRNEPMPNEGEFRAYHLLLLMGTHGKYKYNSTEYRKALKVISSRDLELSKQGGLQVLCRNIRVEQRPILSKQYLSQSGQHQPPFKHLCPVCDCQKSACQKKVGSLQQLILCATWQECEPVKGHPALRTAMALQGLLSQGNWSSFFRNTLAAPYLLAALAQLYFPALRTHALRVLSKTLVGRSISAHGSRQHGINTRMHRKLGTGSGPWSKGTF